MKRISLKTKSVFVVLLVALLIASVSIVISYQVYSTTMDNHFAKLTMNVAKAAASQMDGEILKAKKEKIKEIRLSSKNDGSKAYFSLFDVVKDKSYDTMLSTLFELKEANDVLYMYIQYVNFEDNTVTYIMDADAVEPMRVGDTNPIVEQNVKYLGSVAEKGLPSFISNSEQYGWLSTAAAPILDSDKKLVALVGVDISMNDVMKDRFNFLVLICAVLIGATILVIILLIFAINRSVVRPINSLASAAGNFVSGKNENKMEVAEESDITRLQIHTGDEIENLCIAIKTMEQDINTYIKDLTAVTAEKERIGAELNIATRIQASMLPSIFPPFPDREEFDIFASMQPAKEVGGDFYDFFMVDDDHLAIVIADVSGKGVPAALFMVIAKTLIKNHAQNNESPADAFTNTNAQLCETNEGQLFVTGWMGVLEISTGKFVYVNAGHNPPLLKKKGGSFEYLRSRAGFVLAGIENMRYRQNEIQLQPGDVIYLYTDGVTEATDIYNELYGEDRLQQTMNENSEKPLSELLPIIKADIDLFAKGAPQFDDITMLGLYLK